MENCLVSARIPSAKKDAVQSVLKSMGSSTTELINGAFDYLLEQREIPRAHPVARDDAGLAVFLAECQLDIPWPEGDIDYKQLIREGKRERYESLA